MKHALVLASFLAVAPAFAAEPLDCDKVGDMASDIIKRKAGGLTERQALAELSSRGDYRLGFVVKDAYQADPAASPAVTRAEIVLKCKRINQTGNPY